MTTMERPSSLRVIPSVGLQARPVVAAFLLWLAASGLEALEAVERAPVTATEEERAEPAAAAVTGQVESVDRAFAPTQVLLTLEPVRLGPRRPERTRRGGEKSHREGGRLERRPDERGRFRFDAVPPGLYRLRAELPGFAPVVEGPFAVEKAAEVLLGESLRMVRPFTLEIQISPQRDPLGRPWTIVVGRRQDVGSELASGDQPDGGLLYSGPMPADGRLAIPDQAPGIYFVEVHDRDGNTWANQPAWLAEPGAASRLELELEFHAVRGELRLGDEPVAGARIDFGGSRIARRIELVTDAAGRFEGTLPRVGTWRVEITTKRLPSPVRAELEIASSGDEELVIQLPATEVQGRVVDANRGPAPRALVFLETRAGLMRELTGPGGTFTFRGLVEGETTLWAETRGRRETSSQRVELEVRGGVPVGPVELVLVREETVEGRVSSPWGPVQGAMVYVSSEDGKGRKLESAAKTDADGAFSASCLPDASTLTAVVSAIGLPLQAFELSPGGNATLGLALDEGRLEVRFPARQLAWGEAAVVLTQGGVRLPDRALSEWARLFSKAGGRSSSSLMLSRMAPGLYRACLAEAPKVCQSEFLVPGGAIVLDLGP